MIELVLDVILLSLGGVLQLLALLHTNNYIVVIILWWTVNKPFTTSLHIIMYHNTYMTLYQTCVLQLTHVFCQSLVLPSLD